MLSDAGKTIGCFFRAATQEYGAAPFIIIPADRERGYLPEGATLSYSDVAAQAEALAGALGAAGYGHGNRIAVLAGNRPGMLTLKLALADCGISWVPVNPDYRAAEIAYVLEDSGAALVVTLAAYEMVVREAAARAAGAGARCPVVVWDGDGAMTPLPPADDVAPCSKMPVTPESEASLLYTSGTTGRPKGCMISHAYELSMGTWYSTRGGAMTVGPGERLYNPLPLFHVNAGIVSFYGMMATGGALIIPERFSARRWWADIKACGATACHYLGIVIPALMNAPPSPSDREHDVRWAFGAGVEPTLHRAFEERFGFPLVEGWGMTEMCRILVDTHGPRQVDTRAMGRPSEGLEVRAVDENDAEVPRGVPGEMVVRHSAETPRRGAFSGYLNQPEATERGWRGGWWHTGDTVIQDESGMLYFVDRKKNMIRRSGENIAAAEVEAVLQAEARVEQVAVVAVADPMREEEVLAAVVVAGGVTGDAALAGELFDACFQELAYYKAPGWVVFVDELPVTGTQKVLKHMIFGDGVDPTALATSHDLRARKVREPG